MNPTPHPPPRAFHVLALLWIAGMLAFAYLAPASYHEAMQEDRATEWLTCALFLAAAVAFLVRAVRGRRIGDGLVGAFCIVAAGEEISWGQRLLGFIPSERFLAENAQQEANLHNLVEAFGQPKWSLIAILVAYGVLAPLLVRHAALGRLAARLGFAAPDRGLVPWFVVTCALLIVYPVRFSGEWAEALAGALFLASAGITARWLWSGIAASTGIAFALDVHSARAGRDDARVACARAEASALLGDPVIAGEVGGRSARLHRRVWSVVRGDAAQEDAMRRSLATVDCAGDDASAPSRRRYAVDPWGTAYWIRATPDADGTTIEVYSFGPNRRRDADGLRSDDVIEVRSVPF